MRTGKSVRSSATSALSIVMSFLYLNDGNWCVVAPVVVFESVYQTDPVGSVSTRPAVAPLIVGVVARNSISLPMSKTSVIMRG